jgi:hypothetical protein
MRDVARGAGQVAMLAARAGARVPIASAPMPAATSPGAPNAAPRNAAGRTMSATSNG